jgi:hypothetical protein
MVEVYRELARPQEVLRKLRASLKPDGRLGKDKAHDLQLFHDAGWEHLMDHLGWQYFRQTALDGASPEIFGDNESKMQKYERLLVFLVMRLPLYIPFILLDSSRLWVALTAIAFMILDIGFVAFAFTSLMMRIKQLKKRF